jgi:hypothetical protein
MLRVPGNPPVRLPIAALESSAGPGFDSVAGFAQNSMLCFVQTAWFGPAAEVQKLRSRRVPRRPMTNTKYVLRAQLRGQQPPSQDDEDDVDQQPTVLSRRIFSLTVGATGLFSFVQGFRLFADDDTKRVVSAQARQFLPFLRPHAEQVVGPPSSRRAPLNREFATFFFDAHADVASELGMISRSKLDEQETDLLARSEPLFFPKAKGEHSSRSITDPAVLNYMLYARLRAITGDSSPAQRVDFSRKLGLRCYAYLKQQCVSNGNALPPPIRSRERPREFASDWMEAMAKLLTTLAELGWISSYRFSDFDLSPGSLWIDEGRGALTVYCDDPVTLNTAMLIGEEHYEEISPKLSSVLWSLLLDYGLTTVTFEDYYLDLLFRPDPAEYQPRQIVTQFNFVGAP